MATGAPVPRSTSAWRHLPNAISVLRIVLVLPVALAILSRHFNTALWLASTAGASDALDGWLARRFHWRSRLGGVLDPLADKLLLITCFVCLAHAAAVPWALTALVLSRDLVIATGALVYRWRVGPFKPRPTRLSRICTLVQILYVLVALLDLDQVLHLHMQLLGWLVALLTGASGVDYVWRWSRRAHAHWPGRTAHAGRPANRGSKHES